MSPAWALWREKGLSSTKQTAHPNLAEIPGGSLQVEAVSAGILGKPFFSLLLQDAFFALGPHSSFKRKSYALEETEGFVI